MEFVVEKYNLVVGNDIVTIEETGISDRMVLIHLPLNRTYILVQQKENPFADCFVTLCLISDDVSQPPEIVDKYANIRLIKFDEFLPKSK